MTKLIGANEAQRSLRPMERLVGRFYHLNEHYDNSSVTSLRSPKAVIVVGGDEVEGADVPYGYASNACLYNYGGRGQRFNLATRHVVRRAKVSPLGAMCATTQIETRSRTPEITGPLRQWLLQRM